MQARRLGGRRGARIHHGRQRLIIDRDPFHRIERLRVGFGDDRGDRLAHMAHLAARERKARRLGHRLPVMGADRPQRPHRPDAVRRHVGAGEHRDHPGRRVRARRVDAADHRMGVGRAHQHAVQRARHIQVGHEAPAAEEKFPVLDPLNRGTDAFVCLRISWWKYHAGFESGQGHQS